MLELDPGAWIAILTGHGGDEDRETCLEIGARAFFSKPMSAEALSEGVLQGLQEKADQARNDDA
jgi:CheY-like chemotaxis protein